MKFLRLPLDRRTAVFVLPAIFLFSRALADLIVVLVGAFFLYRSYKRKEWSWLRKPWVLAAFALWIYALMIASPLAIDSASSFRDAFPFVRFIIFGAALAYWVLPDSATRKAFEAGVIAAVVFVIIDTFIQYFFGTDLLGHARTSPDRLTGPFHDLVPGTMVLRLAFIAMAALYFSKRLRSEKAKILTLFAAMTVITAFMFATGERGAFLNFLLGCTILVAGLFATRPKIRIWAVAGAIVIGSGVGLLAFTNSVMAERTLFSTYEYIANWPDSESGRVVLPAIDIWSRHNMLTGIGLDNYRIECPKPEYADVGPRICSTHPHNIYVEWLVQTGILGLSGFVLMTLLLGRELFRYTIPEQRYMAALFALAVFLTTFWPLQGSMSFLTNRIGVVIWMTVGWALSFTQQSRGNRA